MQQPETVDNTDLKRKRLIFRSWHRGTREIDLMLGRFADAYVPGFDEAELDQFERILNNSDPDLFNWISKKEPVPPSESTAVMHLLLGFDFSKTP